MIKEKQKGFSLIEIIIYLGLLSIILAILIFFFQEEIYLKAKIANQAEVIDNGQFALNKIVWYLQHAESLNYPSSGQGKNTLSLNLSDTAQNPVVFFIENNVLKIKQANSEPIALNNDRVKVLGVTFSNFAFAAKEPIIQIKIQISSASEFWQNQPVDLQTSIKMGK
jgi:prepilin-type N-terminal cleavage/methylation domain-containing protein